MVKQPKKLTREHKEYLRRCKLDPTLWMLLSEDTERYIYVNKVDGSTKERLKYDSRKLRLL